MRQGSHKMRQGSHKMRQGSHKMRQDRDMFNKTDIYDIDKSKIYVIIVFLGIMLLFYSVSEIRPIIVNITDPLGLASHLTPAYWIGYILIIIFSMRLYFDRDIQNDGIYVIYLIAIGLFLFGLPIFAEENARFAWSYHPAGEVKSILETGTLGNITEYPLGSYRSWPTTHMVSAFIISTTGINTDDLVKYIPIFWVLSVILVTFSTGKLFKLPANSCFLIAIFVISSFWTINYYYGPPSLAYILYLLFFMSMISLYKRYSVVNTIFMILTFIATIMTHMLTSVVLILSFFLSSNFIQSLYKNRTKFSILFIVMFIGWHMYFATMMFDLGIKEFTKQIMNGELFSTFATEKYNTGTTLTREIIHYSRISYLGIYIIFMLVASIFYIKDRVREEYKKPIKICFLWLIGILMFLAFRYGPEIDDRVYIFSLLPMALIIIMTFDRKIVSILAILLIVLHIPAHYGTESFDMTYTTDLRGSKFLASKLGPDDSVNYYFAPFIRYYDLQFVNSRGFDDIGYFNPNEKSLGNSTYIIYSDQLNNYLLYVFGVNKIQTWLKNDKLSVLLYDNGYYHIYKNNKQIG